MRRILQLFYFIDFSFCSAHFDTIIKNSWTSTARCPMDLFSLYTHDTHRHRRTHTRIVTQCFSIFPKRLFLKINTIKPVDIHRHDDGFLFTNFLFVLFLFPFVLFLLWSFIYCSNGRRCGMIAKVKDIRSYTLLLFICQWQFFSIASLCGVQQTGPVCRRGTFGDQFLWAHCRYSIFFCSWFDNLFWKYRYPKKKYFADSFVLLINICFIVW